MNLPVNATLMNAMADARRDPPLQNDLGTIIIDNKIGWKTEFNLDKVNNQHFHSIVSLR